MRAPARPSGYMRDSKSRSRAGRELGEYREHERMDVLSHTVNRLEDKPRGCAIVWDDYESTSSSLHPV